MSRVVVLQMAMAAYRQDFLDELDRQNADVHFIVGDQHFAQGVFTEVASDLVSRSPCNKFGFGRRIGYQPHVLRAAISAKTCIVEVNPRNLSTWAVLIGRKMYGRRTWGWGHTDPRDGVNGRGIHVRRFLQRSLDGVIVYTQNDANHLRLALPQQNIEVASNALYRAKDMRPSTSTLPTKDLLWMGRLVAAKNPVKAITTFASVRDRLPPKTRLIIIGDGPLRRECEETVAKLKLADSVVMHGAIFDLISIRNEAANCLALLCTGYVGLNAIQALGFGLAVVFPQDEPHAPEIEALGAENSLSYLSTTPDGCDDALLRLFEDAEIWRSRRSTISQSARSRYSVESMVKPFVKLSEKGEL
jgi:glycosyltransferase involved in cell wall biosynthesis